MLMLIHQEQTRMILAKYVAALFATLLILTACSLDLLFELLVLFLPFCLFWLAAVTVQHDTANAYG